MGCLLERSASERPPSPVGEARVGKLERDVLQGFVETVREKPTHPSIPTLAMVCASRSSALSLRSPKMADVFAPTSFKHGPAPRSRSPRASAPPPSIDVVLVKK